MPEKITFLLGAGASAMALPTVKKTQSNNGFAGTLIQRCSDIERMLNGKDLEIEKRQRVTDEQIDWSKLKLEYRNVDVARKIIDDFNWLASKTHEFGTPDTFARYLYFTKKDSEDLKKLKETLNIYFTLEQYFFGRLDRRTITFLVSIIDKKGQFPSHAKILNWNYDNQLQIASELYFKKEEFYRDEKGSVHTTPFINHYPVQGYGLNVNYHGTDGNEYSMLNLNGLAGYILNKEITTGLFEKIFGNQTVEETAKDFDDFLDKMKELKKSNLTNIITFAWEESTEQAMAISYRKKYAKDIASGTNYLVIIGYSFPYFNREFDNEIFLALLEKDTLKKIYFQDPYNNGEFLRSRYQLKETIEIIHIADVENYHLPIEL